MKVIILLSLLILIFFFYFFKIKKEYANSKSFKSERVAIVGAMDEEIDELIKEMKNIKKLTIANNDIYEGELFGKLVIVTKSGIGMVSSALMTTIINEKYNLKYLIFSGVAGALNEKLEPTDIVVSTDLVEYLFDTTAFGYKLGQIPRLENSNFKADNNLLDFINFKGKNFNIYKGRIVSGDKFISDKNEKIKIGQDFDALAVDMESAAFAQVCSLLNKRFLVIRSISDTVNDKAVIDYNHFVKIAVKNNIYMIEKILKNYE